MDFPSCPGPDLFFSILFAALSDTRSHRPGWCPASAKISGPGHAFFSWMGALLVCSVALLAFQRRPHADGHHDHRTDCVAAGGRKHLATAHAVHLFRVLSVLCQRRRRLLKLPVRRNAARSRLPLPLFCTAGPLAWIWRS